MVYTSLKKKKILSWLRKKNLRLLALCQIFFFFRTTENSENLDYLLTLTWYIIHFKTIEPHIAFMLRILANVVVSFKKSFSHYFQSCLRLEYTLSSEDSNLVRESQCFLPLPSP